MLKDLVVLFALFSNIFGFVVIFNPVVGADELISHQLMDTEVEFQKKEIVMELYKNTISKAPRRPYHHFPARVNNLEASSDFSESGTPLARIENAEALVNQTLKWPYSVFGHLEIDFSRGEEMQGSGTLVHSHHIMTAASNVYNPTTNDWATSIKFTPGRSGDLNPFGTFYVVKCYLYKSWKETGNEDADIALLILSKPVGHLTGWAGIMTTLEDHLLRMEKIEITGYSKYEPDHQMRTMLNHLKKTSDKKIIYMFSATTAQAGSGVWNSIFGEPYLIGVHESKETEKVGTRLSITYFNQFMKIISETADVKDSSDIVDPGQIYPETIPLPLLAPTIDAENINHVHIDVISEELLERKRSVEITDAKLQCILANSYYMGIEVPQDYTQAVELYTQSAQQGYAEAQHNLGLCYLDGTGVLCDNQRAVELFTLAANNGYSASQYILGLSYLNGLIVYKNAAKACNLFEKAARQGHILAQNALGDCYANGDGVYLNYGKAMTWWVCAGNQGHTEALYNIGYCYYRGVSVPRNIDEAAKWFYKSAINGHSQSQYILGGCFENGDGVIQDYTKAVEWYTKAANQNNVSAQYKLGECYRLGRGVSRDRATAEKWKAKANSYDGNDKSVATESEPGCICIVS